MPFKSKSKPKPKADIRGLDPAALLVPRSMAGRVLGGKSVATLKKLESKGLLTPVRLTKTPEGQVFYRRAQLLALAGVSEAANA